MNASLRTCVVAALVFAALWQSPRPAAAADHDNLEEGLPVQVEDAYPIEYRGRELQLPVSYDRTDEHDDRVTLEPRLEVGFARNWQGKVFVPVYTGSADRTGSGNVGAEALYNFNTESLRLPAFALSGRVLTPTGKDSNGIDSTLKLLATKSLTRTGLDRLHLNASYSHKFEEADDERRDRYSAIVGYSRRAGPDTLLVADFIREQELERDKESNIVELGVREQLDPLSVLSLGVGAGIGDDSPELRVVLGIQRSI